MAKCEVRRRTPLRLRLWFYIIQALENTQRKNSVSMANGGKTFFIVIHRCSFVKAAINVPRVCKLRKKGPTSIDKCAMVLSKRLNFLLFH
jgi:hypothetical protein